MMGFKTMVFMVWLLNQRQYPRPSKHTAHNMTGRYKQR